MCFECCYLYDDKLKCSHCQTIILTDLWYENLNNEQLCLFCCEKENNKCTQCNINNIVSSRYKGENGKICQKCYKANSTKKMCEQCNMVKKVKNWYNTKNGIICRNCLRKNKKRLVID